MGGAAGMFGGLSGFSRASSKSGGADDEWGQGACGPDVGAPEDGSVMARLRGRVVPYVNSITAQAMRSFGSGRSKGGSSRGPASMQRSMRSGGGGGGPTSMRSGPTSMKSVQEGVQEGDEGEGSDGAGSSAAKEKAAQRVTRGRSGSSGSRGSGSSITIPMRP